MRITDPNPREGQIWICEENKGTSKITLTNPLIDSLYRTGRLRVYHWRRTPLKVRIRHFFEDLLEKLRK